MIKIHRSKSENGYSKVRKQFGGMSFKEISNKMKEKGEKIEIVTSRHIFIKALEKIAIDVCKIYDENPTPEKIKAIASNPMFQSAVAEMLQEK